MNNLMILKGVGKRLKIFITVFILGFQKMNRFIQYIDWDVLQPFFEALRMIVMWLNHMTEF